MNEVMDLVWNETLADQVRTETERAMQGQSSDMRRTAEQLQQEATRHELRAAQLRAQLPIMTWEERTRSVRNSDGNYESYSYFERVINVPATHAQEEQARQMEAQARQVRQAATQLLQAAETLDRETARLTQLFANLHAETQHIDGGCAKRMQQIKEDIYGVIRRMEDIRDGFGDGTTSSSAEIPLTIGGLASAALAVVNPQLAAQLAGVQSVCADGLDPINLATGNFYYTKEDINIPGRYPLSFTRFYNAIGGFNSNLGPNWTHNYNIRLHKSSDDNHIRITFEDGHAEIFTRMAENRYVSQIEHKNTLAVPKDEEGGYVLIRPNFDQYRFDDTGALRRITTINGDDTHFEYTQRESGTPRKNENTLLTEVRTASGSLSFTYNEADLLTQVTDHTGRQVTFEYNNNNNTTTPEGIIEGLAGAGHNHSLQASQTHLTKVTHASGAIYQYTYDPRGLISQITTPMGHAMVQNEYDSQGRAIRQQMADGGIAHVAYNDAHHVNTVTEQNGNKIEYHRDEKYRTTRIDYDGYFDERFVYDDNNNRTQYTDRRKNSWRYEYDIFGNMTKTIDPLGNETEIEYSDLNKPTKITTPAGGNTILTYDDYGNVTGTTDPLGRQMHCTLDDYGRVTVLTLPDTSTNTLEYDARGNITSITDATGATTQYEYDNLNRVTKVTNGEGAATHFEYNTKGDIKKVTDAQGHTRSYEYNASGKVTKITDFNGTTIEYSYNNLGKVEEITDQSGGKTKLTYDIMWNVTGITDPLGNTVNYEYNHHNWVSKTIDQEGHATTYKHDPNGNVISVTSPLGTETIIRYDSLNRQSQVIEPDNATTSVTYDKAGNITQVTDPLGNTTTREYDLANQLTKVTDPLGNTTTMTYTTLGQVEQVTNAKGNHHTYSYYPGGRLKSVTKPDGETETYTYNKTGNITTVTDAFGNQTTLTYDTLGRVTQTTNQAGHSKHFAYDAVGNITAITDENGHTTQYKYSQLNDVVEVIDATGHSTKYSYDAAKRLTALTQYNNIGEPQITTYERNKKGEVIATTSPLGDIVKYAYDQQGRVTSKVDEDSHETLYAYNLTNQLAKISYADGKTVAFEYNALKQLTEMHDWLGTTTIELDQLGRATKVTDYDGNEVGYAWNALGQREKLTYPDGKEISYEYTPSGKLSKVLDGTDTTTYTYDPLGRLSERVLPDNTITKYEFTQLGTLASLTHSKADNATGTTSILDQFKYSYDPSGNITQIEKHRTGIEADNGIFKYAYDPLNRLIEATRSTGVDTNNINNNINAAASTKQYSYDPLGNRVSSIQNGKETRHSFNARNQLIQTLESDNTTITNYHYDKRGNLTQVTENGQLLSSYTFDATNMMTGAFNPDKGTAEYAYNGFRSRVKKLENYNPTHAQATTTEIANLPDPTKEVRYVLDITRPYDNLIMTQGTQNQSFTWGNSLLSGNNTSNETDDEIANYYYLQDHLGSPIRLLSEGDRDNITAYDEFGVPVVSECHVASPSSFGSPFGFTGYQTDDISNIYYAQARFYNPTTGRFGAEDPLKDQLNWYCYCNANPVNFIDPSGLISVPHSINPEEECGGNTRGNNVIPEVLGGIQLNGYLHQRREILDYLNRLTDHYLDFCSRGFVYIATHINGGHLMYGNALIERIISSAHVVQINLIHEGGNTWEVNSLYRAVRPNYGSGGIVSFNPASDPPITTFNSEGIAVPTSRPAYIGLAHELIHADRAMRGVACGRLRADVSVYLEVKRDVPRFSWLWFVDDSPTEIIRHIIDREEAATIGISHYTADCITENMIRREHGLPERASHLRL